MAVLGFVLAQDEWGAVEPRRGEPRPLAGVGSSAMDPVAYDTAFVARLQTADGLRPMFPQTLKWLLRNQRSDGSWGSAVPWGTDRLIATAAAAVALAEAARRGAPVPARALDAGVRSAARAVRALERYGNARRLDETVGFELCLPPLLEQGRALGLDLPAVPEAVWRRRSAKLAQLPDAWHSDPPPSLVHSLEGWAGDEGPLPAPDPRYGCANSPSATAFRHHRAPTEAAAEYLRVAVDGGGARDVYPFDVFETVWSLDHMALAGRSLRAPAFAPHIARLRCAWSSKGAGIAQGGLEADADDTAMTAVALCRAGIAVDAEPLRAFERTGGFACFQFERDPSVSANIHVSYALSRLDYRDRAGALCKVLGFLADAREPEGCWTDKWHASPLYATSRAVIALHRIAPDLIAPALAWLRATQHPDGSWGAWGGSPEETAYAVEALVRAGAGDAAALQRAADYLRECGDRPALWVGKGLYCPRRVVDSAVAAARRLAGGGRHEPLH